MVRDICCTGGKILHIDMLSYMHRNTPDLLPAKLMPEVKSWYSYSQISSHIELSNNTVL